MLLTAKLNKNDDDVNLTTLYFRELPGTNGQGEAVRKREKWVNGHTRGRWDEEAAM